jgi:hypothetical protein
MLILTAFAEILATREKLCGNEESFEKKIKTKFKKIIQQNRNSNRKLTENCIN